MKTLIIVIASLFTQMASASFVEICQFNMEVLSVGELTQSNGGRHLYTQVVEAQVLSAEATTGGHTSSCDRHIGEAYKMDLSSAALADLVFLKQGYNIQVDYRYVSGFGPQGVVESTSFKLLTPSVRALEAVESDDKATEELKKFIQLVGKGHQEPVEQLSSSVQFIPGGICGFVGCEQTHLVSITYGYAYYNGPTVTIVAKVNTPAYGEPAVTILSAQ